jgi:hypothetical protein
MAVAFDDLAGMDFTAFAQFHAAIDADQSLRNHHLCFAAAQGNCGDLQQFMQFDKFVPDQSKFFHQSVLYDPDIFFVTYLYHSLLARGNRVAFFWNWPHPALVWDKKEDYGRMRVYANLVNGRELCTRE